MLFDRFISIFTMTSLKQHIEYFRFRCKLQLDLPVDMWLPIKANFLVEICQQLYFMCMLYVLRWIQRSS